MKQKIIENNKNQQNFFRYFYDNNHKIFVF
jgi:hypothetical protein